jgi:hypothetical protein
MRTQSLDFHPRHNQKTHIVGYLMEMSLAGQSIPADPAIPRGALPSRGAKDQSGHLPILPVKY